MKRFIKRLKIYFEDRKRKKHQEDVECLADQAFREIMDRIENRSFGPIVNGSTTLEIPVLDRLADDVKAGRVKAEMFKEVALLAIDKVNAIIDR